MERIQSKFKSKHSLFISAIAILLLICMIPTQVYAASYEFMEGSYYGGGDAGKVWTGKKITGAKWPSSACQNDANYGYRFYIVDSQGNIQSSVKDLIFFNPDNYKIRDTEYASRSINGKPTVDSSSVKQANRLTSINSEATIDKNKKISIYSAYTEGGQLISGESFKQWMEYKGSNGVKNSTKVIAYLYDDEYKLKYGKSAIEYLGSQPDWYLIIEPTMLLNVWTNVEWAPYVKTTEKKHYLLKTKTTGNKDTYIDLCCNKTEWDYKNDTSSTLYNDTKNNRFIYSNDVIKEMGGPAFYNELLREAYVEAYNDIKDEVYFSMGSKLVTVSEYLTDMKKINTIYDSFVAEMIVDIAGSKAGESYPYTVKEEINYAGKANGVADAVEMWDFTTYCENARKENGELANTSYLESKSTYGPGYHAVTFNLGYVYGTWYNQMIYLRDKVPNSEGKTDQNDGEMVKEFYNYLGNGFKLSESVDSLNLRAPINNVATTTSISASTGNGIHVMRINDPGNPIHTVNPIDPTPENPNDPIKPEQPKKTTPPDNPFDNTGKSTIIKVYGEIYEDNSKVYHIKDKETFSETQTTDWIVVEDEPEYKLIQWWVSDGTPDKKYTASQWLTDSDGNYVYTDGFDKAKLFSSNSSGYKLEYSKGDNFRIGESNTIYLLYLKTLPCIDTSDKKVPDDQTQLEPNNPTYIEDPNNNPDKQGNYNIIKIYAEIDSYNGEVKVWERYEENLTTEFIRIESENNWQLVQWKVTNTYNPYIQAEHWSKQIL